MMTQAENDLLTRTGPGTPCGKLLRSYWQPIAASEEMPPGGDPLPVRIMSEDLVLFRDDQDRLGLIGLHCPHRGTDLSYGRVEDGGLRCLYHGWLFDRNGACLDQPAEPAQTSATSARAFTSKAGRSTGTKREASTGQFCSTRGRARPTSCRSAPGRRHRPTPTITSTTT